MGLADLRDAIAALDAGRSGAADLERSIQDALLRGVLTRNEACRELRSAASQSAAAGIIARLDLESASPGKYVAPRLAEPNDLTQSQPRPPGTRLPARDPVSVAGQPRPKRPLWAPAPQSSSTDRSVDPEPYTALIDGSKMIGQVLGGRYRLDSQVESGVLGAVFRAADLAANETPFAVNVVRPEFGRFSEAMALLRAEIRVTRMLRHPHIARVYSLNSDRQGVYLVTEFLEGRTLEAVLRENGAGLPLIEARRVAADMCAALAYAHDLDVVHGDLQPANVFVMLSGRAKLLHFGLVRAAATRNGRFDPRRCGSQTIAYAASEMLQGGAPDPRDDVYSLACIIYTMLSGAHPFGLRSAVEARDLALAMTPLQILSGDQNAALAQALSFEHAQRTPSVTALLAGLGWTADPPAAAAPAHASEAIQASAAATAESAPPAAAASQQPTAPRPARRVPVRLPIPLISAIPQEPPKPPKSPKSPKSPKPPAPPAPRESRRILMPALIVLSLSLLVVGIGIYVHRRNATSVTAPSHTAINPPGAASPMAPSPAAAVSPGATASRSLAGAVASSATANRPPVAGTKTPVAPIPVLRPLPKAAAAMADSDNCPYPREAVAQGLTGTVFLLVFVASDGKATQIKLDKTSGSDVLDQAAVRCVEQYGRFAAPDGKSSSGGYWGRIRFKWSFGA